MSASVATVLDAVANEIRRTDLRLTSLRSLLARIESCDADCFTAEEVEATHREIAACEEQCAAKRTLLEDKIHLYEDQVLVLERKLAARKEVIEQSDDATAETSPALFGLFVAQHASMTTDLDLAKSSLLEP